MNLKKIGEILKSPISDKQKELVILDELSKDENVLVHILTLLSGERNRSRNTISDLNLLVSKSESVLQDPSLNRDGFVQKEINEFYEKNKELGHCFRQPKNIQKQ